MKKPFRGDGMAFAELLYDNANTANVAHSTPNSKCTDRNCSGPLVAKRDGRNMSHAIPECDNENRKQVINNLRSKLCEICAKIFDDYYREGLK